MDLLKAAEDGRIQKSGAKKKLTIGGRTEYYPVYLIPLAWVHFNDKNGRINTELDEYLLETNKTCQDIRNMDTYNDTIGKLVEKSNKKEFEKLKKSIEIYGQKEPGTVLEDGLICDGNRRGKAIFDLHKDNPSKFGYFEAVILRENIHDNAKEIKLLEFTVQHGTEKPVDYNPINWLADLYNCIVRQNLVTAEEVARSTNKNVREIEKDVNIAKFLVEYLEYIRMPMCFHVARNANLDGPIRDFFPIINGIDDLELREEIKMIVFAQFALNPQGDMTRYIRTVKKILKDRCQAKAYIEKQMDIAEKVTDIISDSKTKGDDVLLKTLDKLQRGSDEAIQAQQTTELFNERIRVKSNRERPALILDRAIDAISDLDTDVFTKLTYRELQIIRDKADELIEEVKHLKEATNV